MAKKSKSARGLTARGAKGAPREKLAKAAGFRSDAEIAELFPENRQKLVRQLQQALADLVSALDLEDSSASTVASHYGALVRALDGRGANVASGPPGPAKSADTSGRASKQASLATDALRQMVLEAVESPLALLPSLLADDTLSDQRKLQTACHLHNRPGSNL